MLVTPFGRKRIFFDSWNDDLAKTALSYVPQSTVGDMLNAALRRIYDEINEKGYDIQIMLQVHDSMTLQCKPVDVEIAKDLLKRHMEKPVIVNNKEVKIPTDVYVGNDWLEVK